MGLTFATSFGADVEGRTSQLMRPSMNNRMFVHDSYPLPTLMIDEKKNLSPAAVSHNIPSRAADAGTIVAPPKKINPFVISGSQGMGSPKT